MELTNSAHAAIEEAEKLIATVQAEVEIGGYAMGSRTAVSLTIAGGDKSAARVDVSIQAFGHVRVPWRQFVVTLQDQNRDILHVPLNGHGYGFLSGDKMVGVKRLSGVALLARVPSSAARDAAVADDLIGNLIAALSPIRFTATQGTTYRVDPIEVTVRVQRTSQESVVAIQATCGTEARLDWRSVGVMVESDSGTTFSPKWFNEEGRVEFRLQTAREENFQLRTSVSASEIVVGSAGLLIADAAERGPNTSDTDALFAYRVASLDQRVTAAAWRDPGGVITVQVETRERSLRNAVVSLEFQGTDGKVLVEDTFQLDLDKRDKDGNPIYWGEWMREVSLPVDSTMRVTTFPRPASPDEPLIG